MCRLVSIGAALDLQLAALVPEQYAAWRPLLSEALLCFLERLPEARQLSIVAGQLALPADASNAQRLVALMQQCPTLHKLGQVVARDRRLAPELRARLQTLESQPATSSMQEILPLIRRELKQCGDAGGLEFGRAALAEASVAVIVPFSARQSSQKGQKVEGVFKVLRPGIEERLHEELAVWPALGAFLEQRSRQLGLPPLDYRDALDSVAELLQHEMHPEQEQAHLAAAARRYADVSGICIPRLLPWCTPHMTAMERIDGIKLTDAGGHLPAWRRRRLAGSLIEALLAQPFWSEDHASVFHADPHGGNLFLTRDERIAILDWGLVTTITKAQREGLVRLALAAATLDQAALCRALAALGRGRPREAPLRDAVGEALRALRYGALPGFTWAQGLLDRVAGTGTIHFAHDLLLFRKALHTLMTVADELVPGYSADAVMIGAGLTRFLREMPGRTTSAFASRDSGCHVSGADLLDLWFAMPTAAMRYWQGVWWDAMGSEG